MSYQQNNWNAGAEGYGQWPTGWNQGGFNFDEVFFVDASSVQVLPTPTRRHTTRNPDIPSDTIRITLVLEATTSSLGNTTQAGAYPQSQYPQYAQGAPYPGHTQHSQAAAQYPNPHFALPATRPGTAPPPSTPPYARPTQIQLTEAPAPAHILAPGGKRSCSHCGATSTPVWRRDPRTQAPLCNACGVYLATRHAPRPQTLIDIDREVAHAAGSGGGSAGSSDNEGAADPNAPTCSHCGTRKTSAWRRNKAGQQVCNACGVYERMNGRPRPLELRNDKVRPREKHRDRS
ncbi:GATA zinc finger domain-containing protein [Mycena chlorophos]|uniref:GATA zinc finger domain-containing protein n=1 Tax=Mycena chlorophos TaxID=658473 RepID=A0A8H6SCR2_MYCCL|nr:GATA zinc finger domain-containing protein [Mycena chlorophos]